MKIEGFNNLPRSGADRTEETRRPERSGQVASSTPVDTVSVDSLETGVSTFIDRSVVTAGRVLDTRLEALRSQRDEILKRADDPRSIRRAAANFVASGLDI